MPRDALLALALLTAPAGAGAELPPIAREISPAELRRTLDGLNFDRTSGRDGERKAAAFLEERLHAYGVKYTRHEMRAYLSWPGPASLEILPLLACEAERFLATEAQP